MDVNGNSVARRVTARRSLERETALIGDGEQAVGKSYWTRAARLIRCVAIFFNIELYCI